MFTVREAAKVLGVELKGAKVAIQGYGNAGYFAATLSRDLLGCVTVAASDSKGGIYKADGLDVDALKDH